MVAKIKEKEFWSEKIPFLKRLKEFYSNFFYKDIPFWPIIANEGYTYYKNQDRGFWERLRLIFRFVFFKENFNIKNNSGKILVSYFMPREDHHKLIKRAISGFSKDEIFFLDAYEHKKNPLKKYKVQIPNFFLFFLIWLKFKRHNLKEILGRYYWLFIARTYQRYRQIDYFQKIINKLKPKGYIAFCSSAFGEESIITLLCKRKNIPTFSLQHGLLPDGSRNFAPSIIQSENNISDYILLWGKSSYDLQKKYINKSKLLIVGNPKYSFLRDTPKKFSPREASVFFSVTGNEESNKNMLCIINNFSFKHPEVNFNLKIHPFDGVEKYNKYISSDKLRFVDKNISVNKLLEKSDFIIVHNSSVAYEGLIYRIPILRFKDKAFIDAWNNPDKFKDLKELEKLFSKLKNKKIFRKFMRFYKKEFEKTFYFHPEKKVPQVYYEKIMKKINKFQIKGKIYNP